MLCVGAGCDDLRDPSTPCGALRLGDAEPGAVVSRSRAPILAMAGGNKDPFVLHFVCETSQSPQDACTLTRTPLQGINNGRNAVLVTSAGDYVLATDRDNRILKTYGFDEVGNLVRAGDDLALDHSVPLQLLTSLRNSNWVIGIDADGQMVRYRPGEQAAEPIARTLDDPAIAAVGEYHIIGQVRHGNDDQALYVVPVDEDSVDVHHEPTLLIRGAEPTRVVVGPRDEFVSITVRHSDTAQTLVFRIPDGELLDRFAGELISGREDMTETVGLRAVSPDGSHLAYKTAAGSVALRDIESSSACLVRSATTNGETRVAGFSAEGKLYFESEFGPGRTSVSVWDAATRYFAVLSTPADGVRLAAVPSSTPERALPWAVGIRSGAYLALADSEVPARLDLDGAVFIPRDDPDLWVFASTEVDASSRVDVRRLTSRHDDAHRYGELASAPHIEDGEHGEVKTGLNVTLSGLQSACISTGTPGARAYACGSSGDVGGFAAATSPAGQDPQRDERDPEVPDLSPGGCSFGGDPFTGTCDGVTFDGCCYDEDVDACAAKCGATDVECRVDGDRVVCGVGTGWP